MQSNFLVLFKNRLSFILCSQALPSFYISNSLSVSLSLSAPLFCGHSVSLCLWYLSLLSTFCGSVSHCLSLCLSLCLFNLFIFCGLSHCLCYPLSLFCGLSLCLSPCVSTRLSLLSSVSLPSLLWSPFSSSLSVQQEQAKQGMALSNTSTHTPNSKKNKADKNKSPEAQDGFMPTTGSVFFCIFFFLNVFRPRACLSHVIYVFICDTVPQLYYKEYLWYSITTAAGTWLRIELHSCVVHLLSLSLCACVSLSIVRGLSRTLGFQPKMHRLRLVHTFLWYVVYGPHQKGSRGTDSPKPSQPAEDNTTSSSSSSSHSSSSKVISQPAPENGQSGESLNPSDCENTHGAENAATAVDSIPPKSGETTLLGDEDSVQMLKPRPSECHAKGE